MAGRTQFANDLLATELADQLRGTRVEVTCVFRGVTDTAFLRNARGLPGSIRVLGHRRPHGASHSCAAGEHDHRRLDPPSRRAGRVLRAAGVNSADGYASRHHQSAGGGSVVLETNDFDYFPSHYVNQATEIEELPAQF